MVRTMFDHAHFKEIAWRVNASHARSAAASHPCVPSPVSRSALQLIATCPEETKSVLEAELRELGATEIAPLYRALTFQMSEEGFYDAHLRLRTASRVFRVLREGSARTPEMLFDQARRVPWPKLFDVTRGYLVE